MKKTALGLPFEYQKFPEYFDALNINENTNEKNAVIEHLLKKQHVKTVLDMTCGTGSQVFYLSKHGYKVTGSDFSPDLLKIARIRAKKEKVTAKFIDGDMRTLKAGTFDAVITILTAVSHLTKSGFEKAIKNIHQNLKAGGVYVFDVSNIEVMTDKKVSDLSFHVHKKLKGSQIHAIQCSVLDKAKRRLISYDTYVIQKNADKPRTYNSTFLSQIYSAKEVREMLLKNGFEIVGQYDMDGSKFLNKKSSSILTVARKV